ncbi:hypothetical protein COLO4_24771 [Corchorus olitorius]|uniref:Uncharacterized protein n=1 Tax=Corchorus olitorius TaxID=93759 RepID=A0A1R3I760_9ROSI|nr:hypothetical protein COLO4_24771 [Corchorus olitorius]
MPSRDMRCCNGRKKMQLGKRQRRQRSVQMKAQKLQRVVPGTHGLLLDHLLLHTAHYILHLRLQLCLLEALVKFHHP